MLPMRLTAGSVLTAKMCHLLVASCYYLKIKRKGISSPCQPPSRTPFVLDTKQEQQRCQRGAYAIFFNHSIIEHKRTRQTSRNSTKRVAQYVTPYRYFYTLANSNYSQLNLPLFQDSVLRITRTGTWSTGKMIKSSQSLEPQHFYIIFNYI